MLTLPILGMVLTTGRVGRRAAAGGWSATQERPGTRGAIGLAAVATLALAAYTWWPNGDYRPIQPGEPGTLVAGVRNLPAIPSGRPALVPERAEELGGAPSERDVRAGRVERTPAAAGTSAEQDPPPAEDEPKDRRESEKPSRTTSTSTTESTPTAPPEPTTSTSQSPPPAAAPPPPSAPPTAPAPPPPTPTAPLTTAPAPVAPTTTAPATPTPDPTTTTETTP